MHTREEILNFLKEIDNDFPTPLNKKVNLDEYVDKIMNHAEIITKTINGNIIGLTVFYCNDFASKIAYAVLTGVSKDFRGMGIGTELKSKQIEFVKNKGFKKLIFHTENPDAQRIYEKLGGKVVSCNDSGRVKLEIKFD